jgi:C4-dicarboxylate transporter DctQ subunit
MSFIAIGMGIRKSGHICVETLVQILPDRWKRLLILLMGTLGMGLGIVLISTGSLLVYSGYERGQVSSAMEIPIFLAYICIPLGGLLCTFRFLELVLKQFGSITIPQEEVSKMKVGM